MSTRKGSRCVSCGIALATCRRMPWMDRGIARNTCTIPIGYVWTLMEKSNTRMVQVHIANTAL